MGKTIPRCILVWSPAGTPLALAAGEEADYEDNRRGRDNHSTTTRYSFDEVRQGRCWSPNLLGAGNRDGDLSPPVLCMVGIQVVPSSKGCRDERPGPNMQGGVWVALLGPFLLPPTGTGGVLF